MVEKPSDPPTNPVMTGLYTFTPAIFHACHLVDPSDRGEYELSDAIDLVLQSGRTIDSIPLEGWRIDITYPKDRDWAGKRLHEGTHTTGTESATAERAADDPHRTLPTCYQAQTVGQTTDTRWDGTTTTVGGPSVRNLPSHWSKNSLPCRPPIQSRQGATPDPASVPDVQ